MAEQHAERQKPARQFTWVWMVLSLALVGLFLAWLASESEPTQVTVVEEEPAEEAGPPALTVSVDSFAAAIDSYSGQNIRLQELNVVSNLGSQMFWTELPGEQGFTMPYLVVMDTAVTNQGTVVNAGDRVTVVGQVYPVTDSVLDAWQASGALADDAQRMEAEVASSYLQAIFLEVAGGSQPAAQPQGGDAQQTE